MVNATENELSSLACRRPCLSALNVQAVYRMYGSGKQTRNPAPHASNAYVAQHKIAVRSRSNATDTHTDVTNSHVRLIPILGDVLNEPFIFKTAVCL